MSKFFFTLFILYFRKIQIRNMLYALYLERSIFLYQLRIRLIYHSIEIRPLLEKVHVCLLLLHHYI